MDGQQCPTSNAQQLRVVQQLLWDVISLHLYPAERDEIRRALGSSLLDENEALFAEAGALADILGDVQLSTSALISRHQLCSNPQRSMIQSEIRLLVERLHASAGVTPYGSSAVKDRDPDSLLPRSGKRDKAVLEYVTTVAQIAETGGRPPSSLLPPRPPSSSTTGAAASSGSRPGTSSRPPTALSASASMTLPSPASRPGTASPTLHGSRPSTASSAASSAATRYTDAPSVVAVVADQLNITSIDAVKETLRAALMDERTALMEDIEYLQGLLDAEADLQVRAAAPPPTLAELKDYSSRLAAVVADEEARVEHEVRVSAMFAAAEQQNSKPGRLRGMVDASRRPPSAGSATSSSTAAAAGPAASPPGTASSGSGLSPVTAPPPRRGSLSGGAQTLVVHGGVDEDAVRQQPRQPSGPMGLGAVASGPPRVAADGTGGGMGGGSPLTARMAPLAAVRRPGSGGSGVDMAPPPFPPVLPPAPALRSAVPLPSTRLSPSPPTGADGLGLGGSVGSHHAKSPADSNGLGASTPPPGTARALHSAASPGRMRAAGYSSSTASLPVPLSAQLQAQQQQQQQQGHIHLQNYAVAAPHPVKVSSSSQPLQPPPQPPQQVYRDKSPSLKAALSPARSHGSSSALAAGAGGGARPGAAAAASTPAAVAATLGSSGTAVSLQRPSGSLPTGAVAGPPAATAGLRPVVPRSGSVGRTPGAAASVSSSSTGSSGISSAAAGARVVSRGDAAVGRLAASVAAATAFSPGGAVAARLAGASAATGTPESYGPAAVQPRALLHTNKQRVVDQLEEEMDKLLVEGGVAVILERHNIRPSTPGSTGSSGAAGGAAPPPAVVAPPPSGSRGGS